MCMILPEPCLKPEEVHASTWPPPRQASPEGSWLQYVLLLYAAQQVFAC